MESYREQGRDKKRVIAKLGRLDLLKGKLDDVVRSLRRYCEDHFVLPEEIASETSGVWGPILVARHLWEQVGLSGIIHERCRRPKGTFDVAETAFVLAAKDQIERELYRRVRDLFSMDVDLVFYDVTSTYFQRREATGTLRRHGLSRDGHPREVQVVVGVVMANGRPIAHHVFPGNTADKQTLQSVVADLHPAPTPGAS